jgi:H2-forming N5,N10-methylenetetrahydromethanopterin dehydrogenase-like enzyme
MANAELNVILSAEAKQLTSALQKAEKDVQGLEKELGSLRPAFDQVDKSIGKTANSLKSAASSTNQFTKGVKLSEDALKKLPNASNASTQSLLNFSRIVQDAPFGIMGIANNINPALESFQRLQKESGSTGAALKGLAGSLIGPGGLGFAVAAASSLLVVLGDSLFGTKEASKASENALKSFSAALEGVKDNVKLLSDELQFANQLGGINVKIRGAGAVQDLIEQSVAQQQNTVALKAEAEKLKGIQQSITDNTALNAADRIEAEQKYFDQRKQINADIRDSEQKQSILYRSIALQRIEDQKEAAEKAAKLNDKYIDQTIARAKRLSAFLTKATVRNVNFDLDPELTRGEQLTEALKFIEKALNDRSKFMLKPQVLVENPVLIKSQSYFASLVKEAEKIKEDLQNEITKLTKRNPIIIQAQRATEIEKARGEEFFGDLGIASANENAPKSLLTDAQKSAVNLANVMKQTVVPAFDDLFNAIKAGESPIKAFFTGLGQAIQQLIQKLLQAVLQAALLSAITGGTTSFGSAFKSILGFKADGGPVLGGKPYVVGERGPELFIPTGGGRIVPNNEMNSGLAGVRGSMQPVVVTGRIRNRDIILGNARESRSQNR